MLFAAAQRVEIRYTKPLQVPELRVVVQLISTDEQSAIGRQILASADVFLNAA